MCWGQGLSLDDLLRDAEDNVQTDNNFWCGMHTNGGNSTGVLQGIWREKYPNSWHCLDVAFPSTGNKNDLSISIRFFPAILDLEL